MTFIYTVNITIQKFGLEKILYFLLYLITREHSVRVYYLMWESEVCQRIYQTHVIKLHSGSNIKDLKEMT